MLVRQRSVTLFDFLAPNLIFARHAGNKAVYRGGIKRGNNPRAAREALVTPENRELFLAIKAELPRSRNLDENQTKRFNDLFARLRDAARQSRPLELKKHWDSFVGDKRMMGVAGATHWKVLSQDIARMCQAQVQTPQEKESLPNGRVIWTQDELGAVRTLALKLGAEGQELALASYLALVLRRGDYNEVLSTYQAYAASFPQNALDSPSDLAESPHDVQEEVASHSQPATDLQELFTPPSIFTADWHTKKPQNINAARAQILLCLLTVHFKRHNFRDALGACLNHWTPLSSKIMDKFTSQLPTVISSEETPEFKKFVYSLSFLRLAKSPASLTTRIADMSRQQRNTQLEAAYASLKAGLFGPDTYLAVNEQCISKERNILLPESVWASFISAFIKCKLIPQAELLWDDMLALGIDPPMSAWNALIDGYGNNRGTAKAISTWKTMETMGIKPEALTYRAIIHAYFVDNQTEEAMNAFKRFQQEIDSADPAAIHVYNTTIHLLLLMNSNEAAVEPILEQMRTSGPKPDLVTFNALIRYHGRRGNFTSLATLTREMEQSGIKPDEFTYATLLSALLRAGRKNAADMVLGLMVKNGTKPTVVSYSAIMHFQLRDQTEEGLLGALDLLKKMENDPDPGVKPNVVTYTTILASIHRGTWLSPEMRQEKTDMVLDSMKKRGIEFHRITYHILIPACLENPTQEGLVQAMTYYRAMIKAGTQVMNDTWFLILRQLRYRKDWAAAEEVARDMLHSFTGRPVPKWLVEVVTKIRRRVDVSPARY